MPTKRDPTDIIIAVKAILDQGLEKRACIVAIADGVLTEEQRVAVERARSCSADERSDEEIAEKHRIISRLVADSRFCAPELHGHVVNDIAAFALRFPEAQAAMGAVA
jgi:hypothetical protein